MIGPEPATSCWEWMPGSDCVVEALIIQIVELVIQFFTSLF